MRWAMAAALVVVLAASGCMACGLYHTSTSSVWTEPGLADAVQRAGGHAQDLGGGHHLVGEMLPGGEGRLDGARYRVGEGTGTVIVAFLTYEVQLWAGSAASDAQQEAAFRAAWNATRSEADPSATLAALRANATSVDRVEDPVERWRSGPPAETPGIGPGTKATASPRAEAAWAFAAVGLTDWTSNGLGRALGSGDGWLVSTSVPRWWIGGEIEDGGWGLTVDALDQASFTTDLPGEGEVSAGQARAALEAAFERVGLPAPSEARLPDGVLRAETQELCS